MNIKQNHLFIKNHFHLNYYLISLIVIVVLFLFGCGNSDTTPPPVVVKESVSVSYNLNYEGVNNILETQKLTSGYKATKPNDHERTFYIFNGWFTNKNGGEKIDFDVKNFTKNTTLYAQWLENYSTVTFNLNYPNSTSNTQKQTKDTLLTPPENPTRALYSFQGWFTTSTVETKFDFANTVIKADIILNAKWNQLFKITFETYGGTRITPLEVGLGQLTTKVNTPVKEYFIFTGWYNQPGAGIKIDLNNLEITTNITIYARWTPKTYTVTFDSNYPEPIGKEISPQEVNGGETATLPTRSPWRSGFNFLGWYDTPEITPYQCIFSFATTPIIADKTIYARWTQDLAIIFDSQGGSDVNPQSVKSGNLATRPIDPKREYYTFKGWFTSKNGTTAFDFSTKITYRRTLYAKWTIKNLTIIFDLNYPNPTGETPAYQTVKSGETASQPSPPVRVGYNFIGWYETPNPGISTKTFPFFTKPIIVSKTLYAQWSTDIVVTIDSKGGTQYPPHIIASGTRIQKPGNPRRLHYNFEHWYSDEQNKEQPYDFSTPITTSKTLFAKWRFSPLTKQALIDEIEKAIKEKGDNVDLNYINTSYLTDMSGIFKYKAKFNGNISQWNVEGVKNMQEMFYSAKAFNQNINSWNVSSVTDMNDMFKFASSFHQSLNSWNVTSVTDMSGMFFRAAAFNGNISSWNVLNVENMESMFRNGVNFNSNISSWNVSKVKNMESMFRDTDAFNGNIGGWNVSSVTNMNYMFFRANAFNSSINDWNVLEVESMKFMFTSTKKYNQPMNKWNMANVKTTFSMFFNATSFNQPLNGWDVSNVENMSIMFSGASSFNQPLNEWNVSKVTNLSHMFRNAIKFSQNINNWNVSSVTFTSRMFSGATAYNQPMNNWDTSKVTEMAYMFEKASAFNQDLNNWNTAIVKKVHYMFADATSFNKPVNNWNVAQVTLMSGMFKGATAFNQDLYNWNVENVTSMVSMFEGASNFNENIATWNPTSVTNMGKMFKNAQSFAQNIDSWNIQKSVSKTDAFLGSGLEGNFPSWVSF